MKYRKKPIVIDVFHFTWPGKEEPLFIRNAIEEGVIDVVRVKNIGGSFVETKSASGEVSLRIKTLEGSMYAFEGDFIIKGVEGELYPCKPDIFNKTYELVGDDDAENP